MVGKKKKKRGLEHLFACLVRSLYVVRVRTESDASANPKKVGTVCRWRAVLALSPLAEGSMFSAGTRTPSMCIEPVMDARRETLPSISRVVRPGIPC